MTLSVTAEARGTYGVLVNETDLDLLAQIIGRAEDIVRPDKVATVLLSAFGTLRQTIGAPASRIAKILSEAFGRADPWLHRIAVFQTAGRRVLRQALEQRTRLSSFPSLTTYLRMTLATETVEQFRVLLLDKGLGLIADDQLGLGTVDHAPVYVREIIKRALEHDSSSIILVHNHPGKSAAFSAADIELTTRIVRGAAALDIAVIDHLLVAGDVIVSASSLGYISHAAGSPCIDQISSIPRKRKAR